MRATVRRSQFETREHFALIGETRALFKQSAKAPGELICVAKLTIRTESQNGAREKRSKAKHKNDDKAMAKAKTEAKLCFVGLVCSYRYFICSAFCLQSLTLCRVLASLFSLGKKKKDL